MKTEQRISSGGRIKRDTPLSFTFNGRSMQGFEGDTLASALLANGVSIVARSFKYHRPRGIIAAGAEEPNALVQLGDEARAVPNVRATQVELFDGLVAESVNCWPNVNFDIGQINSVFSRLLPAGFYYKTFMWPGKLWPRYEKIIRRAAGLGVVPDRSDQDYYEKINAHCDLLVVGAGPSGLTAALLAARSGARVIIVDEGAEFGGALLSTSKSWAESAQGWLAFMINELRNQPQVRCLPRTTAFGYYDHNFLALAERVTHHEPERGGKTGLPRERLWRVRAGRVVLATGAIERPLVFGGNDLPGVMLASAVSTYINRYAVAPGKRALVFTNNDAGYQTALDMADAGIDVVALVDSRGEPDAQLAGSVKGRNVDVRHGHVLCHVSGFRKVRRAVVGRLAADGTTIESSVTESVDLIAVSGGFSPVVHLHAQSGGRPVFDEEAACFLPGQSVQAEVSIGAARGLHSTAGCIDDAVSTIGPLLKEAGFDDADSSGVGFADGSFESIRTAPLWLVPDTSKPGFGHKQFVDYQNDTTAADIQLAVREGYRSIEHVKRYTLLGFGTDQGKLGNVNGMAIAAQALGQTIAETGTTSFRPAYTPVTFGTMAGRNVGERFDPIRKTAMHNWHVEAGAEFENVGQWKRPWYYPQAGEDMDAAVSRECQATRQSIGILDASTLGKIEIQGADAGAFLDLIYTNTFSTLKPGRCRYGLMLGEDGMVMDDGVSARLGQNRYYMTTTTGGAANVLSWLERWHQTEWPNMKVYFTSVTDHWATVSLSGPNVRKLLALICPDLDLSDSAFPFMSFVDATVLGVSGRIFRISFSGELSYEINIPANHAQQVWDACLEQGAQFGITPYGTETMHVLRAEKGFIIVGQDTDGSVTPVDLGMQWIVSSKKEFLGRRSLQRADTERSDRKQLVGLMTEHANEVLPEGAQLIDVMTRTTPVPMVGHVTSSYYSSSLGHSIALALVKNGRSLHGESLFAPLIDGRTLKVKVVEPVFYDSHGARQHD